MKTRSEMVYEFMLALASNGIEETPYGPDEFADEVFHFASALTQKFLDAGGF